MIMFSRTLYLLKICYEYMKQLTKGNCPTWIEGGRRGGEARYEVYFFQCWYSQKKNFFTQYQCIYLRKNCAHAVCLKHTQSVTQTVATGQIGTYQMRLTAPVGHLNPRIHRVLVTFFISLIVLSPFEVCCYRFIISCDQHHL